MKTQGNWFIVHKFSSRFWNVFSFRKAESVLQSKQSDHVVSLRLTLVVVVVSGFHCECFLPNSFLLFPQKSERGWKWREKYQWAAKEAKANVNMGCSSLIKGQWKLFIGQWKVREFLTFWWVATLPIKSRPAPVFPQPTPFCPWPAQSTDETLNLLRTQGNLPKTHSIYPGPLNLARDHYNIATTNGSLPMTHSDYVRPTSILLRHQNPPTTHRGLATVNSIYPWPPQFTYDPLTPPKTLVNLPTTQSI